MAAKTQNAVTAPKSTAVGDVAVPDFMKQYAGQGTEAIGASEIEIPRIKLLQAISPEIEAFEGVKVGEFFHSIAEESLGREVLVNIILVDQRYILWRPRWEGGGILARADDGVHWNPANASFTVKPVKGVNKTAIWNTKRTVEESGLAKWGSSNPEDDQSQPAATKMFNLLVNFPERPDLGFAVVTLQRAGIAVARKLMGKLKITQAPSYGINMLMSSVAQDGQEGPFQNFSFRMAGFVQDQERFLANKEAYERFRAEGLNIKDLEGAQDEAGGGGVNAAGPDGAPDI